MQSARNSPSGRYVLDSYAILAYLNGEPGSPLVLDLLRAAEEGKCSLYASVVNLAEVVYIEERERGLSHAQEVLARLEALPIQAVEVDRGLALEAAHMKAVCPIAFADCFAGSLGKSRQAIVVTGDREFERLALECGVNIEWLTP